MNQRVLGSLARIADFDTNPFEVEVIPRADWETGDFVQGQVVGEPTRLYQVECETGEMIRVDQGDEVIGAFGHRAATLEGVGSWMEIDLSLIHISEPTRLNSTSRMPSSA